MMRPMQNTHLLRLNFAPLAASQRPVPVTEGGTEIQVSYSMHVALSCSSNREARLQVG